MALSSSFLALLRTIIFVDFAFICFFWSTDTLSVPAFEIEINSGPPSARSSLSSTASIGEIPAFIQSTTLGNTARASSVGGQEDVSIRYVDTCLYGTIIYLVWSFCSVNMFRKTSGLVLVGVHLSNNQQATYIVHLERNEDS